MSILPSVIVRSSQMSGSSSTTRAVGFIDGASADQSGESRVILALFGAAASRVVAIWFTDSNRKSNV
jgi:hypothetical protein